MTILNYETYRSFVKQEYRQLNNSRGNARRRGVEAVMGMIGGGSLEVVDELLDEGIYDAEEASNHTTEASLEITSFLYSAGAEHLIWRRWSSLTAFGMFLRQEILQAAQYAAIGGEWDFLEVLSEKPAPASNQISEQVLWTLLQRQPVSNIYRNATDDEDNAWLILASSIPSKDHRKTETALKSIANFWMEEDEGDWINFHPGSYPDFETPICAAAAIARHNGFTPTSMSSQEYSFLEAGLAIPEPSPLFPNVISLPET